VKKNDVQIKNTGAMRFIQFFSSGIKKRGICAAFL